MVLTLKKNGRYWSARAYDGTRTPKDKLIPLRLTQKAAAMRKIAQLQREINEGRLDPWNPAAPITLPRFTEAVKQFLESREDLRPKTREAYDFALRGLSKHVPAGLRIDEVHEEHIRPFLGDTTVSVSTRRHRFAHIRVFFRWAIEEQFLTVSPLQKMKAPKAQRKVAAFLSESDLERILEVIDEDARAKRLRRITEEQDILWLRDIILVAVCTGMRRGELCHLKWESVNLGTGQLVIVNHETFQTKSHHERPIPIAGDARMVLERLYAERRAGESYVFASPSGGPRSDDYVSKRFKKYVRLAGLNPSLHFHSLRHTCASWLVMRGVPLMVVKEILGHSDLQVTQAYAHLAPAVMTKAMEETFGGKSFQTP